LFDAAGFGLNAGSEDTCPADVVQESAGTQRTIINILAAGENKGWLARVHIDDVLMMLAVETGAGMTIVNKSKVLSFIDALDLEPSLFEFHTANGELLEGVGLFYATLQLGPVVLENFRVTVADVVGDGLLGMDFLAAMDAWVDLKDGHLHMKQDGEEITWPLRHEDQTARYVAMPIQSVTVDPCHRLWYPAL
jgi:predicted aspartyl protease